MINFRKNLCNNYTVVNVHFIVVNSAGAVKLLPLPPSSLAPIKSRIETFWYQLTEVVLEMPLNKCCCFEIFNLNNLKQQK